MRQIDPVTNHQPPTTTMTTATLPSHSEFKLFTGAELEIVYVEYRDPEDGHVEADVYNEELFGTKQTLGNPGRCACCNKPIMYSAGVYIKPLDFMVTIGRQCAVKVDGLSQLSNVKMEYLRDRKVAAKRANEFTGSVEGLAEVLEWCKTPKAHYIAKDMASKIRQYGSLSEKQLDLLFKLFTSAKDNAAKDAEFAPTGPAPEGKQLVTGTILGFKEVESDFGSSTKMIVRLDGTFAKVYVTLPASIAENAERGSHIQFSANFKRSTDDQFFAFGSRPTKASILGHTTPQIILN